MTGCCEYLLKFCVYRIWCKFYSNEMIQFPWSDSFLWVFWMQMHMLIFLCRCRMCAVTFFNKSDMQIHAKSHTEAKPHKCPHCSKSFANSSYLAQHIRIHSGAKPYTCSYCQKTFRQLSHLQQHTRYAWVCDLLKNALLHLLQDGARALNCVLRLCSHLASFLFYIII